MKANELRIGNLLRDKVSKTELKVIELTEKGIVTYVIDRSKFPLKSGWGLEPIQLTEEILLKCGFEVGFDTKLAYQKSYSLNDIVLCSDFILSYHDEYLIQFGKPINFLHQLQNLYFALTNEELTFNNL